MSVQTAMQRQAAAMTAAFAGLEAADKELSRVLQECAGRAFSRDDPAAQEYLRAHKNSRAAYSSAFGDAARSLEVLIEQAKPRLDRTHNRAEVEADFDRLVIIAHSADRPSPRTESPLTQDRGMES